MFPYIVVYICHILFTVNVPSFNDYILKIALSWCPVTDFKDQVCDCDYYLSVCVSVCLCVFSFNLILRLSIKQKGKEKMEKRPIDKMIKKRRIKVKEEQQVGTELDQAQLKLGLDFNIL